MCEKKNVTVFVFAQKPNLDKQIIFIQTNSFIIFACPNPVLLVPDFRKVGQREDVIYILLHFGLPNLN